MSYSRRSVRTGAILSFLLLAWITVHYTLFSDQKDWGLLMYGAAIGASLLVWPGLALRWERPKFPRAVWMVFLFFMTPLIMMIAVERLNGNYITGFLSGDEDILANYVVYALLYLQRHQRQEHLGDGHNGLSEAFLHLAQRKFNLPDAPAGCLGQCQESGDGGILQ